MSEGREDYGMGGVQHRVSPGSVCRCIRVTVRVYRIVDIRYCDSSCMDGKHPYEVMK